MNCGPGFSFAGDRALFSRLYDEFLRTQSIGAKSLLLTFRHREDVRAIERGIAL